MQVSRSTLALLLTNNTENYVSYDFKLTFDDESRSNTTRFRTGTESNLPAA